jgi:hypothetical protein
LQRAAAKDVLLQASPEKIKKQQEDADRAMKELLEDLHLLLFRVNDPAKSRFGRKGGKKVSWAAEYLNDGLSLVDFSGHVTRVGVH